MKNTKTKIIARILAPIIALTSISFTAKKEAKAIDGCKVAAIAAGTSVTAVVAIGGISLFIYLIARSCLHKEKKAPHQHTIGDIRHPKEDRTDDLKISADYYEKEKSKTPELVIQHESTIHDDEKEKSIKPKSNPNLQLENVRPLPQHGNNCWIISAIAATLTIDGLKEALNEKAAAKDEKAVALKKLYDYMEKGKPNIVQKQGDLEIINKEILNTLGHIGNFSFVDKTLTLIGNIKKYDIDIDNGNIVYCFNNVKPAKENLKAIIIFRINHYYTYVKDENTNSWYVFGKKKDCADKRPISTDVLNIKIKDTMENQKKDPENYQCQFIYG